MMQLQKSFVSYKFGLLAELARMRMPSRYDSSRNGTDSRQNRFAHSVLTCSKNAEGAASQPQLHNHANDFLKHIATSLKVCLSGLAMHIVTTSDSITCSQAYAGVHPESLHLGLIFSTIGIMQGDESEIQ